MSKTISIFYLSIFLSFSSITFAIDDLAVMGLIKDKAILRIDGVHFTIKKGESPIKGVQLIDIEKNRKTVTLKIDDVIKKYRLGHGTNTAVATVKLPADSTGIYRTEGKINNKQVPYIIDTGATFVSLNSVVAEELGIDYKKTIKKAQSETANGLVEVYIVTLDSVEVGGIKLNNVEAAVHEGDFPSTVLLGMSFLKQLKMKREGDHTDHLGTPQQITDSNQNTAWEADYSPFGEATLTTELITNNLRFPGQYYDQETNLHYNYFRYLDPRLGRFITSDPIGLNAGSNTYGYVDQNPIRFIDPLGLRASYCQRPLGDFSGENGSGPPVFNHQFICVTLPDGSIRCDSQNNPDDDEDGPFVPTPGTSSLPERDNEENSQCEVIDDDEDRCFEECVLNQFDRPRPLYAIGPLGTDCQEYSSNILDVCRQQCSE